MFFLHVVQPQSMILNIQKHAHMCALPDGSPINTQNFGNPSFATH